MDEIIFDIMDDHTVDDQMVDDQMLDDQTVDDQSVDDQQVLSENEIVYIVSDDSVDKQDITEILNEIRGLREDVKSKQYIFVSDSVSGNVSYGNKSIGLVSDNIIDKPLKDYSTSEALGVIGILVIIGICLTYIIHKSIFKIRR